MFSGHEFTSNIFHCLPDKLKVADDSVLGFVTLKENRSALMHIVFDSQDAVVDMPDVNGRVLFIGLPLRQECCPVDRD